MKNLGPKNAYYLQYNFYGDFVSFNDLSYRMCKAIGVDLWMQMNNTMSYTCDLQKVLDSLDIANCNLNGDELIIGTECYDHMFQVIVISQSDKCNMAFKKIAKKWKLSLSNLAINPEKEIYYSHGVNDHQIGCVIYGTYCKLFEFVEIGMVKEVLKELQSYTSDYNKLFHKNRKAPKTLADIQSDKYRPMWKYIPCKKV